MACGGHVRVHYILGAASPRTLLGSQTTWPGSIPSFIVTLRCFPSTRSAVCMRRRPICSVPCAHHPPSRSNHGTVVPAGSMKQRVRSKSGGESRQKMRKISSQKKKILLFCGTRTVAPRTLMIRKSRRPPAVVSFTERAPDPSPAGRCRSSPSLLSARSRRFQHFTFATRLRERTHAVARLHHTR